MRVGTRSVLFGAHAFWLHPFFVAWAWAKLFGFPFDPRLWVAFFVHDIGYVGKPNMDGPEGEDHVLTGYLIMSAMFGARWGRFTMLHSRYFSKNMGVEPSALCYADKLAIALTPWWLYLPMVRFTGEIREYKSIPKHRVEHGAWDNTSWSDDREWFRSLQTYLKEWVATEVRRFEGVGPGVPA